MTTNNRLQAGYTSPCCEVIEENFEAILCASEAGANGTTEQFDGLNDFTW